MEQPDNQPPKRRVGRPVVYEGQREQLVLEILALRSAGLSYRQIAKRLRIAKSLAFSLCKHAQTCPVIRFRTRISLEHR